MRPYPLYILDLDGTLYRGSEALPHAAETVAALKRRGAIIRYLTNNSSQTPAVQARKLKGMGIDAEVGEVATSGVGAAKYCLAEGIESLFVVGEPGLVEVLRDHSIRTAEPGEPAEAVLAGICRSFDYQVLSEAMNRIREGARFIATNTDATYPLEGNASVPGAGAIVGAIRICSGVEPTVIGKPMPTLVRMILDETGIAPSDGLVVGDRFETDIVAGREAGCDTALVLTGVTAEAPAGVVSLAGLSGLL